MLFWTAIDHAGYQVGGSILRLFIALRSNALSGHDVVASEPAPEVLIGASPAAEWAVVWHGGLAADRAFPGFRARRPLRHRAFGSRLRRHSVSSSAMFGQK